MAGGEQDRPKLPDVVYEHDDVTHWIGKLTHADSKESGKPTKPDKQDNKDD